MNDEEMNLPPEDPTNPENGQQPEIEGFELDEDYDPDLDELNRRGSSIGGDSKKTLMAGILILAGTGAILYYLFSDPPPVPTSKGSATPAGVSSQIVSAPALPPQAQTSNNIPSLPPAPPPPPPPPAPPPPPPPPPAPAPAAKAPAGEEAKPANPPPPTPKAPLAPPEVKAIAPKPVNPKSDIRSADRMRSNMLLLDGRSDTSNAEDELDLNEGKEALKQNDPNSKFASDAIEAAKVETIKAGKIDDLRHTIAQGKILNAILETAINTDLPGTLRAIVSRDVYAEAGKNILIPKGSRLIGTYNTGIMRGQKRVFVVWTRVIRPDGVDIMIGSPGVDALGRAGVEGLVDNKYMESFSAAILTSMISLGVAIIADNAVGDSTTTTTAGSTTNSNSSGAEAAADAANAVGDVGSEIVKGALDLRPTITVDQGTRINVFVNNDLVFPTNEKGGVFIQ